MTAKVCVITGANSGIGRAASASLAASGQTVVMLCRNPERGQAAQQAVIEQSGSDPERVQLLLMDLSRRASIRAGAQVLRKRLKQIDVLINNAAFCDISVKQPILTTTAAGTGFRKWRRCRGLQDAPHSGSACRVLAPRLAVQEGPVT